MCICAGKGQKGGRVKGEETGFQHFTAFFLNPWEREGSGAGSIWELRGDVEEVSARRGKRSGSFSVET